MPVKHISFIEVYTYVVKKFKNNKSSDHNVIKKIFYFELHTKIQYYPNRLTISIFQAIQAGI